MDLQPASIGAKDAPQIAKRIKQDIDKFAVENYSDPYRWHLGASEIGHECDAYLWFKFRWCFHSKPSGRMVRLWQRGHREEPWFIELLRGIGCEIVTHDENGKQFKFSSCNGHFGGSRDAAIKLPTHYGIEGWFLGEFKTQGTGSGFTKLQKNGVRQQKYVHAMQMACYGGDGRFNFGLYMAVNKNDDDLHVELVELDDGEALHGEKRAWDIIYSERTPVKIAMQPTFPACRVCDAKGICHDGEAPDRNCRSCKHAAPVENGEWKCRKFDGVIPRDFVYQGCDAWSSIIDQGGE